jgi:hypothetical protein
MRQITLRVRREIHEMLRDKADAENASMQEVLLKALNKYRRQRFLEDTDSAFGEVYANYGSPISSRRASTLETTSGRSVSTISHTMSRSTSKYR